MNGFDVRDLEAAALSLDARARARLAEKLLTSLEEVSEEEAEALWAGEAERRDAELDSGAAARQADDVLREARSKLR